MSRFLWFSVYTRCCCIDEWKKKFPRIRSVACGCRTTESDPYGRTFSVSNVWFLLSTASITAYDISRSNYRHWRAQSLETPAFCSSYSEWRVQNLGSETIRYRGMQKELLLIIIIIGLLCKNAARTINTHNNTKIQKDA